MGVCLPTAVKLECPKEVSIKHPSGVVSITVKNESSGQVSVDVKTNSSLISNPRSVTIRVAGNSSGVAVFTANYSSGSYDVKFEAYVEGNKASECTVRILPSCPGGSQCVAEWTCNGDIVAWGCNGRANYVCCRPKPTPTYTPTPTYSPTPGPCPSGSSCVTFCDGEIVRYGCDGSSSRLCCKPKPTPTSIQCGAGQIATTTSDCLIIYKGYCAKSLGDKCCCVLPSPSPTSTPTPIVWCPAPQYVETNVDTCRTVLRGRCVKVDGNRCCCAVPKHEIL